MAIDDLLQRNRKDILRIADKHGAYNVRIFGSRASGETGKESDLDLLVDVKSEHSSWFPAGLVVELEQLLGCEVDVVTENALHWFIKDQILKEAQPL